jgi:hypothetical protein
VKDENGDLLVASITFEISRTIFLSYLMYIVGDVMQLEAHTVQQLVLGPNRLDVEIAIAKLKSINFQVVIKFQQKRLKQEVKHYRSAA